MKKLSLILGMSFFVSGCVGYFTEDKKNIDFTVGQYQKFARDTAKTQSIPDYMVPEIENISQKIIKESFGAPLKEEKDGDQTTLYYTREGRVPFNLLFLGPIPFWNHHGDNLYNFSFSFYKDKLRALNYDLLEKTNRLFVFPKYKKTVTYGETNPFEDNVCTSAIENVDFSIGHIQAIEGQDKITFETQCIGNKLLGIYAKNMIAKDFVAQNIGYTKFVFSTVSQYNESILKFKKSDMNDFAELISDNLAKETDRIKDNIRSKPQKYANRDFDCVVVNVRGNDYEASNKGNSLYLVIENTYGLCFAKKSNIFTMILNSNRYPSYYENTVDTQGELIKILDSLKIINKN